MTQTNTSAAPPLTETQKAAMARIKTETEKRAAPVALKMAGIVKQIYENMLADKPDEELRQKLDTELKMVVTELLTIKGQSMREMVGVLTPEQKELVKVEMRKPNVAGDLGEVIGKMFPLDEK